METVAGSPSRKGKCPLFCLRSLWNLPFLHCRKSLSPGEFRWLLRELFQSFFPVFLPHCTLTWYLPTKPTESQKGQTGEPWETVGHSSPFLLQINTVPFPKLPKGKGDYKSIPYTAHWAYIYPWLCLSFGNRNKCNELQKQAIRVDY